MKYIYLVIILTGYIFLSSPNRIALDSTFCEINLNHLLGCDRLGRDIFTLLSYGSISTLVIAIPAKIFSIFFSLFLSLISYTSGRYISLIINSFSSVFLSIPSLLIALVIIYSFGKGFEIFLISLILSDWAMSYETIYSKISEISNSGYVYVSKNFGGSDFYIFKKHIIPELFPLIKILFITGIPSVIMTIAIYSYMGINFGSDYFGPGLGEQISFSRDYFDRSPLSIITPVIGIFLLVNVFNTKNNKKIKTINEFI